MMLPPVSSLALKEWAVAVDALAGGKQIIILRKGGIHRDDKEFRMLHSEFLLYPTFEHQRAGLLQEQYRGDLDRTLEDNDVPGLVTMSYWCSVTDRFEIRAEQVLDELSPHHIWSEDYAQKRLHWRPKHPLTVALLRVYELQQPQALPVLDEYLGCRSWVELGQDLPLGYMTPVLSGPKYEERAGAVRRVLEGEPLAV